MFNQQTPATGMYNIAIHWGISNVYQFLTHIATEGSDFSFAPRNISFPAGVTIVIFNVTIMRDNILEEDEFFALSIDASTLPERVTVGSFNDITTITIANDDSK